MREARQPVAPALIRTVPYAVMVVPYLVFLLMNPAQIRAANNENGLFENLGAACFVLGAGLFFVAWLRSDGFGVRLGPLTLKRNIIYLGLAALLFLGAAEELSWGQRIVHYPTPAVIGQHNMQGEFNIHNLEWFHPNDPDGAAKSGLGRFLSFSRLSTLFAIGATVALPVAYAFMAPLRRFLDWMRIPAPALWIAPLLLLSYAGYRVALATIDPGEFAGMGNALRMYEVREFQLALIFAVIGASEAAKMGRRRRQTVS